MPPAYNVTSVVYCFSVHIVALTVVLLVSGFLLRGCPSVKRVPLLPFSYRLFSFVPMAAGARQRVNGVALAPLVAVGTLCFRCSLPTLLRVEH